MLGDTWKCEVHRIFVQGINKLHQPSKKLDFSSVVMRNGLVLPCVTFRPTHRIACILYSVQDKEDGLLGKMIKSHRWPNLSWGWRTPNWTTELLHLNIHIASPLDKFTVLEKKSTIQKRFEEGKKFEIQKEIQNSWGLTQGLGDRYNHTPSGPACLAPIKNMFSPVGTPVLPWPTTEQVSKVRATVCSP